MSVGLRQATEMNFGLRSAGGGRLVRPGGGGSTLGIAPPCGDRNECRSTTFRLPAATEMNVGL
ncbi:hypothetical protein, partial [Roseiflexus sp.]